MNVRAPVAEAAMQAVIALCSDSVQTNSVLHFAVCHVFAELFNDDGLWRNGVSCNDVNVGLFHSEGDGFVSVQRHKFAV